MSLDGLREDDDAPPIVRLRHAKVELALHTLRAGSGRALLLLQGLGEAAPLGVPSFAATWPGPIHALDWTGHGHSTLPRGGGYTAELMMGDADTALQHLGEATVLGRGLGAYVALLLAGARPMQVLGAILADGPGLVGGGSRPASPTIVFPPPEAVGPPDPFALVELARDLRPPDYAASFVRQAQHLGRVEIALYVAARHRPEWLQAVVDAPGVLVAGIEAALEACARASAEPALRESR